MSDFLEHAPLFVLRKIYEACNNNSKYNLKKAMTNSGLIQRLQYSGALKFKERIWCVVCQMEQYYDIFCENEHDPGSAAFFVNYRESSRFLVDQDAPGEGLLLVHPNVDQVSTYRRRKIHNRRRDQIEANHVYSYFETRINAVFNTHDMEEMERHISQNHVRSLRMPSKFVNELDRGDRILLAESARRAVFYANAQFKKLHDVAGSFPDRTLEVDGGAQVEWPMSKPVYNFFVYLTTLWNESHTWHFDPAHPSIC